MHMLFLIKKINLNLYLLIFILLFTNNSYSSIFDFKNKIIFEFDGLNNSNYKSLNFLNFYKLNLDEINFVVNDYNLPSIKNDLNSIRCNIDYEDLVISLNLTELNNNSFLKLNNQEILINDKSNNYVTEEEKLTYYLFKKFPDIDNTKIFIDNNLITIFYKNKDNLESFELEYSNNFNLNFFSYFYLDILKKDYYYSTNCQNVINLFDDNKENINKLFLSGNNLSLFSQINKNMNIYSFYNINNNQYFVISCNNLKSFKLKYIFTRYNSFDCYKEIGPFNLFITKYILDIVEYADGIYLIINRFKLNNFLLIFLTYISILFFIFFIIIKLSSYLLNLIAIANQKHYYFFSFVIIYILYLVSLAAVLDLILFLFILFIIYKVLNEFLKK